MNSQRSQGNLSACLLLFCFIVFCMSACSPQQRAKAPLFPGADFTLTVMHTNDVHSSYGGTTDTGMTCYAALCEGGSGGYVRLDQAVRAIRKDTPAALFLDAGDIFQGSLFWIQHKERMPAALIDRMNYQAIIPGNHEFDEGWKTWLQMVDALQTPVLGANISFDAGQSSPGMSKIYPYIVLEQQGRKIGIVGLITEATPLTSTPGAGVNFTDVQKALRDAIKKLKAKNVKIIIALTHLGLENDRRLAQSMDDIDIIVGAHSHSLLSNTHEKSEGPYPVLEKSPSGAPVLVVTASTASAYVGKLDVGFDKDGIAREWRGDPIHLNDASLETLKAPKPDSQLVQQIGAFAAPVNEMMQTRIGVIEVAGKDGKPLEEPNVTECRQGECLSGNIVTDALRTVPFKDIQIAILNGGALRSSLPGGDVTPGHVLATLPFQNTAVMTKMSGAVLLQALEHGVATYGEGEGSFLQVSGLRYTFKPSAKAGQRIQKAEIQNKNGKWQPVDRKASYNVATVDFIAKGGDGFSMLTPLQWKEGTTLVNDVLRLYIEKNIPIKMSLQNRISLQK